MCSSLIIAILVTIGIIITVCSCCGSSLVESSLLAFTMLRTPCELVPVFSVTGGGIKPSVDDPASGFAWIITPETVGGKQFGDISKKSYYCKKYVGNDFAMVEHIRDLRNKRVLELMQKLNAEEDPNQETIRDGAPLIIPKRELFEQLPQIITVNVKTTSMEVDVNVLVDWRQKGVLKLEITNTNLDLLLEQPAALAAWTPVIEEPDVTWRPSTKSVVARYWDSRKSKYRWKAMSVNFTNMDNDEKDFAVTYAAREVQLFYDRHHNCDDDMPVVTTHSTTRKRPRGDDDDESAAPSDATRKAAKTGCEITEKDDSQGTGTTE